MADDSSEPGDDVTNLISSVAEGDSKAADQLLEVVYKDLRAMAGARVAREAPGATLQPTDLVHETYLRLLGTNPTSWRGRAHFFGAAAEAMRRILIDHARHRAVTRREDDVTAQWELAGAQMELSDLESLSLALDRLEHEDPVKASLVKLRYFVGLTLPQTADALEISRATATRYWAYARSRLSLWITGGD